MVFFWRSSGQDGSSSGVFGQRYASNGSRLGTEFQVNTYTTGVQGDYPAVSADAKGNFVVASASYLPDGSDYGAFARVYQDPCGNDHIDAGEQCDDGNRDDRDCCSSTCQLVPTDCAACEQCDTTAGCVVRVRTDCRHPTKAKQALLTLINETPDKKDKLSFHWMKGAATTAADFGNPVGSTDYILCLFDRARNKDHVVLRSKAPKGATWKAGAKRFTDKDKSGTPDGLSAITLKSGNAGKATVLVDGNGANLKLPTLGLTAPVTAQLEGPTGGACFAGTFASPTKNTASLFKAKGN